MKLTERDQGKTIIVHPGDTIVIQLDENPTTGFTWEIQEEDEHVLKRVNSEYTPPPEGTIGIGGVRLFTFEAKHVGTAQLELKYWRSFVGDSSIMQRYDITVRVEDRCI